MTFEQVNSKGQTYYLHEREVTLKGGRLQTIYFFAKEVKDGAIDALPEGYLVIENTRTGLPILKKDRQSRYSSTWLQAKKHQREKVLFAYLDNLRYYTSWYLLSALA